MKTQRLLAVLVAMLLGVAGVLAEEAGPLTLKEIGKLRLERKTHAQIIDLIKERGLAFQVDKEAAGVLRSMQFKPEQIDLMTRIADGRYAEDLKNEKENAAKAEAEKPQAPKAGTAPQGVNVGPRISDSAHDTINARALRIHTASNTNTKVFPLESVTLICSEESSKMHQPNLKKLEAALRKTYGEPIKTGTDKRSAHIVLLDNRYDYERWVKAMFQIYEKDGITWSTPDALTMALKGPAFLTSTMTVVDLSALTPVQQEHQPIFSLGYLYSAQLMEGHSPDATTNGFGNVCEVILFGHPTIRVLSSGTGGMRELNGAGEWLATVRERLKTGKLATIDRIMRFSTESMEAHEYCEAWSLTQFLAASPELYNRWIQAVRDKEKPMDALLRVYGKTEKELTAQWHKFIQSGK